ncbi:MAG TPA: hypothetical protein G4O06_06240 [Dehalococcoidia bacterium]|nr:hypothetical protein [Dehalococcoidia bacterium]
MDEAEKQKIIGELKDFYKKLKSYNRYVWSKEKLAEVQIRNRDSLREKLVHKLGLLKTIIAQLTNKQYYTQFGQVCEIWADGLSPSGYLPSKLTGLGLCIDATNEAIGKLELTPLAGLELQETKSVVVESPLKIVDAMCLHPKVVEVNESLFKTGNYASAILEAFKAVNNFVKEKSGMSLNELRGMKDRPLMAKVFDEKNL